MNNKDNYQLEIWLGKRCIAQYDLTNISTIRIGRASDCEIELPGDHIAEYHAYITKTQKGLSIQSEQGSIRCAGTQIDQMYLDNKQVISLGPYLLKLVEIEEGVPQMPDENKSIVNSSDKINNVKEQFSSIISNIKNKLSTITQDKLVGFISQHRLRVMLAATLVVIVSMILFNLGDDDVQTASLDNQENSENTQTNNLVSIDSATTNENLDNQRESLRYQQWAKDLMEKEDYEQALSPLRAAIKKLPNDQQIKQLYHQAILKLSEQKIAQLEYDQALTLLAPIIKSNNKAKTLYKDIDILKKQNEQNSKRYEKANRVFTKKISSAETYFSKQNYDKAKQLLLSIDAEILQLSEDWHDRFQSLMTKIENSEKLEQLQLLKAQQQLLSDTEKSNFYFAQCLNSQQRENYINAFEQCNQASLLGSENANQAEAKIWQRYLAKQKNSKITKWLARADSCYKKEKVKCAIDHWYQVLAADEDNDQASDRLAKIIPVQISKAQTLYKQAKAYQDLGRKKEVRRTLKRLQKILPLTDQPLYKKADELIKKQQG